MWTQSFYILRSLSNPVTIIQILDFLIIQAQQIKKQIIDQKFLSLILENGKSKELLTATTKIVMIEK